MPDPMQQARELLKEALCRAGYKPKAGGFIPATPAIETIAAALRAAPEGFVMVPVQTLESIRDSSTDPVARGFAEGAMRAAPECPEGFVLVPVKPTPEMLAAVGNGADGLKRRIWRGMLAARPQGVTHG